MLFDVYSEEVEEDDEVWRSLVDFISIVCQRRGVNQIESNEYKTTLTLCDDVQTHANRPKADRSWKGDDDLAIIGWNLLSTWNVLLNRLCMYIGRR